METILVVEDSHDACLLIERALQAHQLLFAKSLAEARGIIDEGRPISMILLDLALPDGDGLSLCSDLGSDGQPKIPVILLSGQTDVRSKVAAFSMGAEDYIEKPFDPLELQARVSSRLRRLRMGRHDEKERRLGGLRIEVENMRAYKLSPQGETDLDLSPTEHRILQAFSGSPGRLYTRTMLMSRIWGETIVGPRTVDSHVSNLRKKLTGSRTLIESVRGEGYRLVVLPEAPTELAPEHAADAL